MSVRNRRRVPSYWWDFRHHEDGRITIIIETDDPRCEDGIKAELGAPHIEGDADAFIHEAEKMIAGLKAGRLQ